MGLRTAIILLGVTIGLEALQTCSSGFWNNKGNCVQCMCNPHTSTSNECSQVNGQCNCIRPYTGLKCEKPCENCYIIWNDILTNIRTDITNILEKGNTLNNIEGVSSDIKNLFEILKTITAILDANKPLNINDIIKSIEELKNLYESVKKGEEFLQNAISLMKGLNKNNSDILTDFQTEYQDFDKERNELLNKNVKLEESNTQGVLKLTEDAKKNAQLYFENAKKIVNNLIDIHELLLKVDPNTTYTNNIKEMNKTKIEIMQLNDKINSDICNKSNCFEDYTKKLEEANKTSIVTTKALTEYEKMYKNFNINNFNETIIAVNAELLDKASELRDNLKTYLENAKNLVILYNKFNKPPYVPVDLDSLLNEINKEIASSWKEAENLANTIKYKAESFYNASWIIEETKQNLSFAISLNKNATYVKKQAVHFNKEVSDALQEMWKTQDEYNKINLKVNEINNEIKEVNDRLSTIDTSFASLEEIYKKLLGNINENNEIANSLTKETVLLTGKMNNNLKILQEYILAAEDLQKTLKEKNQFIEQADILLELSNKIVQMIRDISEIPEADNFTVQMEQEVNRLLNEMSLYEKQINNSIKKMYC